ncbi:hypothetical protein ABVK25_001900 [Lepraria finkii]|uniref:Uncharacterized protein n=1 Tax=Lepraria finkii TaxID=1340010 RepID=A0ABR4BKI1_9LECA
MTVTNSRIILQTWRVKTRQLNSIMERRSRDQEKKWVKDKETDTCYCINVPVDKEGNVVQAEEIEEIPSQKNSGDREFTTEERLISSPVLLGFSFGRSYGSSSRFAAFEISLGMRALLTRL